MRKSCKHVDITDARTDRKWVVECLKRHYKRYDFKHLLLTLGGLTLEEYKAILDGDKRPLIKASYPIAEDAAKRIKSRRLDLSPVHIGIKKDKSTQKTRLIGKESAMQQIFDHIAVGSCEEIFKRRIVLQQVSSIEGRGQVYGTAMISRWIKADQRAAAWAHRHGTKYYRKTRWYAKADIKKCYPSCRVERFMRLFKRDCASEDILWLWETLLNSHHVIIDETGELYEGFMIGALPSQWACQYMLSFAYRHIMDMHKTRRGKKVKLVTHMLTFMDDFYLSSTSRSGLKTAVKELARYLDKELGLTVKSNWQILDVDKSPVDMMGYLVHADGNITARPRVFLRARRSALRAMRRNGMCLRQAERVQSFKGFFVQNIKKIRSMQKRHKAGTKQTYFALPLRSAKIRKRLHMRWLYKVAARMIRLKSRRIKDYESFIPEQTGSNLLYATA